ncbi:chloride channel protein [Chitinophaga costaii]|uniref:chloride channel protein n=1 Tax=Chitinophaga costaii TaxID=1335309 RepID=UPI001F0CDD3D|nr:chloride channel protein [Chitinophaga costaii]
MKYKRDFQRYSLRKVKGYEIVMHWLHNKLTRTQFLIFSGILVGCTAGMAGVVLKMLVHYIHYFITYKVHFSTQVVFYLVFPFLGIVLTTLIVKWFFQGQARKGIPAILYEIAQNSSFIPPVKMYSQIIQSAVTVGLGGSAGLESPIAVTGAAIGSNYARTYHLGYKERTLLLAAGATAGIASAFNAPIAGMMFAFEILLTGVVFSDFIPLIVSAVCGSLLSKVILQEEVLFHFESRQPFNYHNIIFYLGLGILCGLYARYYVLMAGMTERFFHKLKLTPVRKAALGGIFLSVACVLMPPLFGEGYTTVKELAAGNAQNMIEHSFLRYLPLESWMVLLFTGCVCLLKAFSAAVTIQSGGNGGNFAPSLFSGAFLGYFFAVICHTLGVQTIPVTNLVLVGMAGVMSGVMYAPLTAIFLIAEASSGYDLFIPLMMVTVIAFLVVKWFSPISPEMQDLAMQGKIFTREHDKNILSLLKLESMIETDVQTITSSARLREVIELLKKGHRNIIAVVTPGGQLEGLVTLDELRPIMFNPDLYDKLIVKQIMKPTQAVVLADDSIVTAVDKLEKAQVWDLPVIKDRQLVGFISKSAILNQYRSMLQEHSDSAEA